MKMYSRIVSGVCLVLLAGLANANEADALVKVKSRKVDSLTLLPGADFSQYKKVMITPAEVSFQKDWLRDQNNRALSLARRMSDADAKKILEAARSGFDEIWTAAFKSAGYEVVSEPGDEVLKIVPRIFDLYINAPDVQGTGRSRSYTVEAGTASLEVEARDSVSGALLGRVVDKRSAGDNAGRLQWTTSVSNKFDFERLFKQWANLAAEGLTELKQVSPLPETIQPGQKLPKG